MQYHSYEYVPKYRYRGILNDVYRLVTWLRVSITIIHMSRWTLIH